MLNKFIGLNNAAQLDLIHELIMQATQVCTNINPKIYGNKECNYQKISDIDVRVLKHNKVFTSL